MFYVIILSVFISLIIGVVVTLFLFGRKEKGRFGAFQSIYYGIEDIDGKGILYTRTGEYSAVLHFRNPVRKYSADSDSYVSFTSLMNTVLQALGEGYAIQKQDVFIRHSFHFPIPSSPHAMPFLTEAYFRHFEGRSYVSSESYLVVTQESTHRGVNTFDASLWHEFLLKIQKVADTLQFGGIVSSFLSVKEVRDYVDRFYAMDFISPIVSMTDYKVKADDIRMGETKTKLYSLLDVETKCLPSVIQPFVEQTVNNTVFPVDLMSEMDSIPGALSVVYNQVIFIPPQRKTISDLEKKRNLRCSVPNPINNSAVEDINAVLDYIAKENKQLVYSHYSMAVTISSAQNFDPVTNYIENVFSRNNIHISRRAYNQLELFQACFPGNAFALHPEYDRFLMLSDAALCLLYKEHQVESEDSPVVINLTDRKGVPVGIDITGREGKVKLTDNSNFFVLGGSGTGKSYTMNSILQQLLNQDTEVVIVDIGNSYDNLCRGFNGVYITYTKENPISMNPFKITKREYRENFTEKKNFLKSLIFLIYKGAEVATKLEDALINQTLVEYYHEYFSPFKGFTSKEREELKEKLLLQDKISGKYEEYTQEQEEDTLRANNHSSSPDPATVADGVTQERGQRLSAKLQDFLADSAVSEGERERARNILMRLTPEVIESRYLVRIERQIDRIESRRKKNRVKELSFNSFYEFALERLPQLCHEKGVTFSINEFSTILSRFYKGGEFENTLNSDMDKTLFEEPFIIFEIDKVKDDEILFPIIVLIIMDVFTQKMRMKSVRKCLVIEEAWKAIATPVMAEYIKYLFKTARKHWAMVGIVTQELADIISSNIVKDAIIGNAGIKILLDQSNFRDRFSTVKEVLALSDTDERKIQTINRLENKDGRSPFKEVFIKRGNVSDVYGIEEPLESYITYTSEKVEKDALALYRSRLSVDQWQATRRYVADWRASGIQKSLDFARAVLQRGDVFDFSASRRGSFFS